MNIIFTTLVTDNIWLEKFAKPLANSAKYFHPEIPFKIFTQEDFAPLIPKNYLVKVTCYKALAGASLAKEYQHVIFFDADSLITARLTELLEEDYELAGVRNMADNGHIHSVSPKYNADFQILGVCTPEQYLNSGLVSSRVCAFWEEWIKLNRQLANNIFDQDQGTFNRIFYSGRYKTCVLDRDSNLCHYGISSAWDETMCWGSWKNIQLEDEKLFIDSPQIDGGTIRKQVKVLHLTGNQTLEDGTPKPPPVKKSFNSSIFRPEVYDFLKKISR